MIKASLEISPQTTPTLATFHIHKLLKVVHSMHADHSNIPNNAQCLLHGKKP